MKRNHLQLPSEQNLAGFHGLGLGLPSNHTFLQNEKIACFRRLGLGVAFNRLPEHFRLDLEQYLDGK